MLAAFLLAGCWPSPPPEDTAGPPPATPPPALSGRPKTLGALDLPLDPLANKDQLLRSFQAGRKDPFGNVVVTQKLPLARSAEAGAVAAGSGVTGSGVTGSGMTGSGVSGPVGASAGVKGTACSSLRSTIQVTGLIQGSGSSEAIVVNNATGETGSLRPGDRGGRSTTLLPPGCQVRSINVNAGYLVIAPVNKGSALNLYL
ncbi:MAG: hypothetical protein ACK5RA_10765 [Cyanobacteriota bacterium]